MASNRWPVIVGLLSPWGQKKEPLKRRYQNRPKSPTLPVLDLIRTSRPASGLCSLFRTRSNTNATNLPAQMPITTDANVAKLFA